MPNSRIEIKAGGVPSKSVFFLPNFSMMKLIVIHSSVSARRTNVVNRIIVLSSPVG